MQRPKTFAALLAWGSAITVSSAASAQTVPAATAGSLTALEEIVVTARRSTERLIDVPVAVTALSAATIERAHVSDLTQIAQLTPSLIVASAGSGTGGSIAIRGVATSFLDPGVEQSVGLNVDGVAIGRAHYLNAAQFDLAQVEVLKGPQALFFGKNSPAGVISITSANPTRRFAAMVRAGYEFEAKEKFTEGFVSGPISDTLGLRIAAKFADLDGWFTNRVPATPSVSYPGLTIPGGLYKTSPSTQQIVGRVTLDWKPTTDFSANLKITGNTTKGGAVDSSEVYCTPGLAEAIRGTVSTLQPGRGIRVIDPYSDCKLNHRTSNGQLPAELLANWPLASRHGGRGWSEVRTWIGALNLKYELGPISIASITGYTNLRARQYFNAARDFENIVAATPSERGHTVSEELRVQSAYDDPLNFTFGGFFEDAYRYNGYQTLLGFVGFDASNGNSAYTFRDHYVTNGRTYSGFGSLRWKILDYLELSGGARFTHETKSTVGVQEYRNALGAAFGLAPAGASISVDNSFSNWSPEVSLRYKPTDDLMAYVAYKTGYKSGGISNPATISAGNVVDPSPLGFRPEKSKGFEAGVKAEALDRTLRFDLTGYRYNFTDLQLTSIQVTSYFIRNAGKARTTGAEATIVWQATPELSLHGEAAYNDAKFIQYPGAQCYARITGTAGCVGGFYDRSGQRLNRAPKGTISAGFDYNQPIGAGLELGLSGDATHTSKYYIHENGDPNSLQEGFWRVNANLRLGGEDDRWELALIGRNLTNEYIKVVSLDKTFGVAGTYTVYSIRPHEVVLQGTVRF